VHERGAVAKGSHALELYSGLGVKTQNLKEYSMSAVANFGPHLPILRRYARAMTGSQASGDACVRAALQAILSAPTQISDVHPPKVELFRLFHAVWNPIESKLTSNLRPQRSALLLTAVEGLSLDEAGVVLQKTPQQIEDDVLLAREEILTENHGSVMIIEDESIIAMYLQTLVEDLGHTVMGIATTHAEAVAMMETGQPDLILADIRLADGSSGIDAVKEILEVFDVPVIFITAFPERLLSGERPEPTYLITKPFLNETVTATISQALFFHREHARELAAVN
jgi:CheY-like chemotaxis protein/DNA-directed RNA polymerase specialized sigma24 family protein